MTHLPSSRPRSREFRLPGPHAAAPHCPCWTRAWDPSIVGSRRPTLGIRCSPCFLIALPPWLSLQAEPVGTKALCPDPCSRQKHPSLGPGSAGCQQLAALVPGPCLSPRGCKGPTPRISVGQFLRAGAASAPCGLPRLLLQLTPQAAPLRSCPRVRLPALASRGALRRGAQRALGMQLSIAGSSADSQLPRGPAPGPALSQALGPNPTFAGPAPSSRPRPSFHLCSTHSWRKD